MKLVMEKRLAPSPLMRSLVPVVAAFAALVFGNDRQNDTAGDVRIRHCHCLQDADLEYRR